MLPQLPGKFSMLLLLGIFFSLVGLSGAAEDDDVPWVQAMDEYGGRIWLKDNRRPALYTGNFGDCLGSSAINVTRFDAAYYKDNMTVLFHLEGNSGLVNESLMMYIGVYAYGEPRFDLTFNPCDANIASLCPVNSSVPIEANGIIPVAPADVASIVSIALTIPDFEGQAILRIFSNSTQSEIACYSAVVTNGATFSHPAAVGTVLGIFAAIAVVSSFATAIYGESVPVIRKHYAHSMSVLVVFAVYQHIFFTGALSMNWPSVLVAFWSNYAWAGGMIYSEKMQNSINKFIGSNLGNTSHVGAAGAGTLNENLGGGYDIRQIYGRSLPIVTRRDVLADQIEHRLAKRAIGNSSDGYNWYGDPVRPGLPLPGNFSGFSGTLAQENIPASNAFMTGFLWLLILLAIVIGGVALMKWTLELFARIKLVKKDRLAYFRSHWLGYTALAILRTCFIAFFMMVFLTLFQFTYAGSGGVTAIAAIVFIIFFVGIPSLACYACYYRLRFGNYSSEPDRIHLERKKVLGFIPWYNLVRESSPDFQDESKVYSGTLPSFTVKGKEKEAEAATETHEVRGVHDDEQYTKRFGWLFSRFRRTRWWFFGVWILYEFIRGVVLAGASGSPMVQVFILLVVELIAFIAIIILKPFEGQRLNALVVYLLGFSKVASTGLSITFDVRWNLARITTTVIGVVIIVIQGILTVVLLIAIALGAITSYMSLTRNRETIKPMRLLPIRERYFKHLDWAITDTPKPPKPEPVPEPEPAPEPERPKGPYFSVNSIKRIPKIEDEDPEFQAELKGLPATEPQASEDSTTPFSPRGSVAGLGNTRVSRSASVYSHASQSNLPFGARVHRASWSSRDFHDWLEREAAERARARTPSSIGGLLKEENEPARAGSSGDISSTPTKVKRQLSRESLRAKASQDNMRRVPTPLLTRDNSITRPKSRTGDMGPASPTAITPGSPVAPVMEEKLEETTEGDGTVHERLTNRGKGKETAR